jgi:putative glutamine amidotransferase
MAEGARAPLVLIPACNRLLGAYPFQVVGQKYVDAVRLAGALPLVVPTAEAHEIDALLDLADGIFLTGSPSNVHPGRFGEAVHDPSLPLDVARDSWVLPLIPQALERGIPLLAVCRGFQEVNVALGGSLHQALQEQPGHTDHRAAHGAPPEVQYGPAHAVDIVPGGVLEAIVERPRIEVNSLHGQGVKQLARGLRVEARAPDGVIEAFSAPEAKGFNLCLQWHPEWQAARNPLSLQLLKAFGAACRAYRDRHRDTLG